MYFQTSTTAEVIPTGGATVSAKMHTSADTGGALTCTDTPAKRTCH